MLDDLNLTDGHATAIVERGIEYGVYDGGDEVPSSKKDRLEAAHDLVTFAIDAWVNEGVTPDADDKETAEAGEQVKDILEWAGIEIDDDGDVTYGELPEIEGGDEENGDDGDEDEESETPFDANDIIEGYDDADADAIVELFESGELEPGDIVAIQEYEKENGGRARILKYKVEDVEENGDDDEGDESESDEPWDGYDDSTAKVICDSLKQLVADGDVDEDFLESVKEYESSRETPKKRVITLAEKLKAEVVESDGSDDDDGEEEEGGELEAPLDGYDDTSVKDIKAFIEEGIESEEVDAELVQAILEYEQATKNRQSFVNWLNDLLSDDEEEEEGEQEEEEQPAAKSKRRSKKSDSKGIDLDDDDIESMLPVGLARLHVKSKLDDAEREIAERGLSLPGAYEGDEPQLPNDISTYDHSALSDLLAQFQNAHSTAITAAAQASIWANTYGEIAEYVENTAILDSEQSNEQKRRAEARIDDRVVFFRAKATQYKNESKRWHELAVTFDKKGAVVSRVGGFVSGDDSQGDRQAVKASTRGKAAGATAKPDSNPVTKPGPKARPGVKKSVAKPAAKKPTVKRK